MEELIERMPKVELHAHLNGSLSLQSIEELGEAVHGVNSAAFLKLSRQLINFKSRTLEECFQKFQFMHELTATRRGLETATMFVIRDFQLENVCYMELRTTPKSNDQMSKEDYLECVLSAIKKSKLINGDSITVKLLPSIDRSQGAAAADETLSIVLRLLRTHYNDIVGIDLSGNPRRGNFRDFMPVLEQARQNGLQLALHCAEIENPIEVAEMVAFGMKRCGHGTFLSREQLKMLGQQNVAVECCLTSNFKCGTVSRYDDHHFRQIFKAQDPVVLCTDDSGVFDTTLSKELALAQSTFDLDEEDLKRLTLNAVDHAFAKDAEKQRIREIVLKFFMDRFSSK